MRGRARQCVRLRVASGDDVDVDAVRLTDRAVDDRAAQQLGPPRAARSPRTRAGSRSRRGRSSTSAAATSVAGDLGVTAAELARAARAAPRAARASAARESVGRPYVHADELAVHACGHARAAPEQPLAVRRAGDRATTTRSFVSHGSADAVALAVALQLVVDPVGDPEQRELAERAEIADPEVVRQRGVDLSRPGRCCRAPCAAAAPRASCRRARSGRRRGRRRRAPSRAASTPVICSTTSLRLARCWMLTVEITSMPASSSSSTSCQRFSLRLPGTLVCASSSTSTTSGLRARIASTSISSNVWPRYSSDAAGNDLEVADLGDRLGPIVRLDEADDDVGAALVAPPTFVEHREGLADARAPRRGRCAACPSPSLDPCFSVSACRARG